MPKYIFSSNPPVITPRLAWSIVNFGVMCCNHAFPCSREHAALSKRQWECTGIERPPLPEAADYLLSLPPRPPWTQSAQREPLTGISIHHLSFLLKQIWKAQLRLICYQWWHHCSACMCPWGNFSVESAVFLSEIDGWLNFYSPISNQCVWQTALDSCFLMETCRKTNQNARLKKFSW